MIHGALKALRTHGHHSSTPQPGPWSSRGRRSLLRQREEQNRCCSLIYRTPILRMVGASARYSCLHTPVETSTPPRRKKLVPFRFRRMRRKLHSAPSFLLTKMNPLTLGFILGNGRNEGNEGKRGETRETREIREKLRQGGGRHFAPSSSLTRFHPERSDSKAEGAFPLSMADEQWNPLPFYAFSGSG